MDSDALTKGSPRRAGPWPPCAVTETRLVKVQDLSPEDELAWSALALRSLEPNPFFEPDFLMLSVRHFEGYADTTLVIAQKGDAFTGVFPVVRFDRPRIPPRKVARMIGRPTAVCALGTPLLDASCCDEAMGSLLDALCRASKHNGWPGIVALAWAAHDGPVMDCLRRACRIRGLPLFTEHVWDRGVVRRDGRWKRPLGKTRGRKLSTSRRMLSRDANAEVKLVDRTLDPSVVEDFLIMEMTGWKGRQGGLAFAKDAHKTAWFREWYERCSAAGRLIVLCLQVGEVPVAIEFFVRAGDGLFCFRGAYDNAYSKYAPGAMALVDSMRYLLEHTDALWMDSATDEGNAFLLEIFPDRRTLSNVYIGVGGVVDRSSVKALSAMTGLAAAQRRLRTRDSEVRAGVRTPRHG